jgi:hypothetical protein
MSDGRPSEAIRRKRKSPIQVPQTPSAFHPLAQRNAFRRTPSLITRKRVAPVLSVAHRQNMNVRRTYGGARVTRP